MLGNVHGSHIVQGTGQYPDAETKYGQQGDVDATDGQLNLGTWQGIYLYEFRNDGGTRKVVATIIG